MKGILKAVGLTLCILTLTGCAQFQGVEVNPQKDNEKQEEKQTDTKQDADKNEEATKAPEAQGDSKTVILALDAGHGGSDGGAARDGRTEKDLTLKIANYVKDYLEENYTGFEAYLVREKDEPLDPNKVKDLEMRAQFAKDMNADALVSFHFNASDNHDQNGSMVLISHRDNVTAACKGLGENILTQLEALGLKNRGTVTRNSNDTFDDAGKPLDYYAINRHCANRDIPGIIVEHCYLDNSTDTPYIDSEEDLKALAKADAVGIATYYNLSAK